LRFGNRPVGPAVGLQGKASPPGHRVQRVGRSGSPVNRIVIVPFATFVIAITAAQTLLIDIVDAHAMAR
jgi:hypothetical protein